MEYKGQCYAIDIAWNKKGKSYRNVVLVGVEQDTKNPDLYHVCGFFYTAHNGRNETPDRIKLRFLNNGHHGTITGKLKKGNKVSLRNTRIEENYGKTLVAIVRSALKATPPGANSRAEIENMSVLDTRWPGVSND